jgi:maleate isomerase
LPDTLADRRVLGVLVPYFNSVVEPELADLRPTGVTNQTGRFTMDANVLENVRSAGASLMTCGAETLLIGLSTESIPGGLGVLEKSAAQLADDTGLPVFTASHAMHLALRALDARKLGIVTPFDNAANGHVRAAFEDAGFEIASLIGLACPSLDRIGHISADAVRTAFRDAQHPGADALVQVGTGLPTVHLVDELEKDLGKAVVATNAALYWQALRAAGIEDVLPGAGRLGQL